MLSLANKVLVTYTPLNMQMWANQVASDVANVNVTALLDVSSSRHLCCGFY
jgi:hypothetical protein